MRSFHSFGNDDRHVMAKHSTIYPSSHHQEAVQSLVSTVECALKQVSDWLDRSNSNGVGVGAAAAASGPLEPCAKPEKDPGDKDQGDKDTGDDPGDKPADEEEEEADGYREPAGGGSLCGVLRIGLVAKGLLIKDDMDLELVLMCKDKPTETLLDTVCQNLPTQIQTLSDGTYEVTRSLPEAAILVKTATEPKLTLKITLTSPAMRGEGEDEDEDEEEQEEEGEEEEQQQQQQEEEEQQEQQQPQQQQQQQQQEKGLEERVEQEEEDVRDMNNRSIAWWLKQIGLPQYTKTLESEYYGLEGLLTVTDEELKEAGVEDPAHRATILSQLLRHKPILDPYSGSDPKARVTRKHSLGSSMDLVRTKKDLFRHSVLPRLQRAASNKASASASQLQPLTEGRRSEDTELSQESRRSKRRSVSAYFSQLKLFGGRREMDALKKELEEELKTSTEDLRSHAWYHGPLSREGAEALLERDGDFLVRDSSSGPGDYVLSCYWRDEPMHFKIIRVVLRPKKGYSRELFQFEEDRFDNVPALIRFYVGGRRPISQASGAIVFHPITRTLPIRVISERQAERGGGGGGGSGHIMAGGAGGVARARTPMDRCKRRSLSYAATDMLHLNNPLLRSGSQPANLQNLGRRPSMQSAQSDSNLGKAVPQNSKSEKEDPAPISPVFRTGSEPMLSPNSQRSRPSLPGGGVTLRGSDGQLHPRAPPKPPRVSVVFPNAVLPSSRVAHDDPSSFYDQLVVQVPPSKNKKGHVDRLRAEEKWQSRARLTETSFSILEPQDEATAAASNALQNHGADGVEDWHFERPNVESGSCFRLDRFESALLPDNNRPLEPSVLLALKELFVRADARTISLHMLSVDCKVARIAGVSSEQQRLMGVASGLELVTLPHGHQLRQDLLERHHLISLGVAVDVLGCTGSVGQRAAVLHKVISLAQALKEHAHNLYSFSAVMKALEMPQVVRLEMTWRALRRSFTESAVLFEKKLKPFMKSLSEGDDTVVQGPIAVPHLVPLLMAMEGEDPVEDSERGCQLLYDMLQAARNAALNAPVYQRHAHALLTAEDWEAVPELLEAFRTEFALRLFWGQAGAEAERQERYDKFDKILGVLSDKLEPVEITPVQYH